MRYALSQITSIGFVLFAIRVCNNKIQAKGENVGMMPFVMSTVLTSAVVRNFINTIIIQMPPLILFRLKLYDAGYVYVLLEHLSLFLRIFYIYPLLITVKVIIDTLHVEVELLRNIYVSHSLYSIIPTMGILRFEYYESPQLQLPLSLGCLMQPQVKKEVYSNIFFYATYAVTNR